MNENYNAKPCKAGLKILPFSKNQAAWGEKHKKLFERTKWVSFFCAAKG
jgi:hypothetical protein